MPSCKCSHCTRSSSSRYSSSRRDSRSKCKRKDSPKRKLYSCDCNNCRYRRHATCNCDRCDDDNCEPDCNSQTHHVTIIVKSN